MREKNFWLYTTGMLISFTGSGVQDIALPLFILDLTGSGTAMGTFMIIATVPRLILYPLAGVIGDRVNRKFIMVSMDFGRGILVLILAFMAAQDILGIPSLFAAQFFMSIMNALFSPATMAMLPDLVKEEDLMRANSITEAVTSFSYIVGPILGGIIYGIGGVRAAFLINGISFLGSGVSELFIQYHQQTRKLENVKEVLCDLREGVSFIWNHTGLLILLAMGLCINFVVGPILAVLIPYVLRVIMEFSSEQYGIIQTAFMAGALLGNLIIGSILARTKVEKMLTRGFLIHVIIMFLFAALIFPEVMDILGYASWIMFCAIFSIFVIMGVASALVNTPIGVGLQKLAPTEFRARVFSVTGVIVQAVVPLGYGIMGFLLDMAPAHHIAVTLISVELVVLLLFIFKYVKKISQEFEKRVN
ncbi:MAG: MFS transporter [Theionarchaea archaeon]|nr:MFS transporter [Theionarchaea archaeon]